MTKKYTEELERGYSVSTVMEEAQRCLLCYDAPCSKACPAGTDPAKFIRSVRFRNFKGAAETIRINNALGAVCARVCPTERYCESGCSRCGIDKPIDIGGIQRFVTDFEAACGMKVLEKGAANGKRVAVVGSGPAGLQAAATLLQLGYEVEIFEKADRAGGFLRTIPEYRLPETVVDGEIERVVALGAVIHCGVDVDKAKFEELKAGYDAVLVATGVRKPMILDLFQGNPNVVSAVDLLTEIRSKHGEMNVPASALVLGGGDSAMDAATTLKMLGVKDVIEVTRNEFRASDAEKATAHEMGVITIGGYTPAAVDGKTVTFKHSRLNSELKIEAELIVVALGQNIDNELGLPVERNEVVAEGASVDGKVFVAGDIAKGDKTVVAAVNKGKLAAYEIHNRIGG